MKYKSTHIAYYHFPSFDGGEKNSLMVWHANKFFKIINDIPQGSRHIGEQTSGNSEAGQLSMPSYTISAPRAARVPAPSRQARGLVSIFLCRFHRLVFSVSLLLHGGAWSARLQLLQHFI